MIEMALQKQALTRGASVTSGDSMVESSVSQPKQGFLSNKTTVTVRALAILSVVSFGTGWYLKPRARLDEEVVHSGFFQVDTKKILSTTVDSLRSENQLVVWSYKGTSTVQVSRDRWWIFHGQQRLIVPYTVNYSLDLSRISYDKVEFNEKSKIVTVHIPKLTISDIIFQPEGATTINGGLLTYSDATVQELAKIAYDTARRSAIAQAQQRTMVDLASAQAKKNVSAYFEIPLRIAGQPDVKVVATFN